MINVDAPLGVKPVMPLLGSVQTTTFVVVMIIYYVLIGSTQQCGKLEFVELFGEWFTGRCGTRPCPPHL